MLDLLVSVVWLVICLLVFCLALCLALWVLFRPEERLLPFLRRVYFLRIPILTLAGVWSFCLAALILPGTRSLLGNAFDLMGSALNLDPGPDIVSRPTFFVQFAIEIAFVSFSACLLGSVVMVTWRLVRLYGPKRFFNDDSLNIDPNTRLQHLMIFLPLIALPVVAGALYRSIESSALPMTPTLEVVIATVVGMAAATVGLLLSLAVLWLTVITQRRFIRSDYASPLEELPATVSALAGKSPDLFLPRGIGFVDASVDRAREHSPRGRLAQKAMDFIDWLLPRLPRHAKRGYIGSVVDSEDAERRITLILPGHVAATILLALALVSYLFIGIFVYTLAYHSSVITLSFVPTLCYLLLLAMLLCWAFSSLAFFFDRYRIPVLIPFVSFLLIASLFGSDYYFPTETKQAETQENTSAERNKRPAETMVVVAANGGGIQAAAWTARVLAGLEQECQAISKCGQRFGKSIRLISSVSGGSVGTMYFVNEYENDGTLPDTGLKQIVTRAEGSSLDHIAWGLLYPDLVRTANILPWAFGLFRLDRGQTLDKAWLREDMTWPEREGIEQGLSEWQDDAEAGRRPGVIFNTTIAETGDRLPLSTVRLPQRSPGGIRYRQLFEGIEPKPTIPVVTATRLSAAFPYVSPAARARKPPDARIAEDGYHEDHIVDGGYYDNYGISSLVEWLDWKLEKTSKKLEENRKHRIEKVLVVEIIASPSVDEGAAHEEEGWLSEHLGKVFYQVIAPAETAMNVRSTGQRTHNAVELELLREKWAKGDHPVEIVPAHFVFDGTEPPLSWHLTKEDKQEIEAQWQDERTEDPSKECTDLETVMTFLTGEEVKCG